MSETAAHAEIEDAARESRGRLLAYLATRAGGDLAGAEDALAEAFLAALRQWPVEGVPVRPEAWLLQTARRRLIDAQRRGAVRREAQDDLRAALESAADAVAGEAAFPDERLGLMFVCEHPAIDAAARTPLMLQVVLGIEVARMAPAFLVSSEAMARRLVRAKAKIRAAGVPFRVPGGDELGERLAGVMDAIYAAYTLGSQEGGDPPLALEALGLARLLHRLLPVEPEVAGLLALLLHCEARRDARLDEAGRYVPLPEQDARRWNRDWIHEAEFVLAGAARAGRMGRFQIEAAIQSAHARRVAGLPVPWAAVVMLYDVLLGFTPALGARVARALAIGRARGAESGLSALEELPAAAMGDYQPYWAARADLSAAAGRVAAARKAYAQAVALAHTEPVRSFLRSRAAALDGGGTR